MSSPNKKRKKPYRSRVALLSDCYSDLWDTMTKEEYDRQREKSELDAIPSD